VGAGVWGWNNQRTLLEPLKILQSQIQALPNKEAAMTNSQERRNRHDRRMVDCAPPQGWKDRRRTAERRFPDIVEQEVSDAEWALYFGGQVQTLIANTLQIDEASEVLNRIRD
jgi:hypothetical protein